MGKPRRKAPKRPAKRKAKKRPPAVKRKTAPRRARAPQASFRAHPTGLPAGPSFADVQRAAARQRAAAKGAETRRRNREAAERAEAQKRYARQRAEAKRAETRRRKQIERIAMHATDALADYIQTRDEADYSRFRRNKRKLYSIFDVVTSEPTSTELEDLMHEILTDAGWDVTTERALRIIRLS